MYFDLFHSVSDPVVNGSRLGARQSVENFLSQARLAEDLGMDTVWIAESHFSSETQKKTRDATIPNFHGEVGLNADSFQLMHLLVSQTKKISLGTGIHNIVGGSGGPIASADRVNFLHFMAQSFWERERKLRIGIASGRFPYQNTPFGLNPRNDTERAAWPWIKRTAFLQATEIFLRLLRGEELSSEQVPSYPLDESAARGIWKEKFDELRHVHGLPLSLAPRWQFETLKLTPEVPPSDQLEIVLGSSDPLALEVAKRYWDIGIFNLSFTPPDQIEALHDRMIQDGIKTGRAWKRSRLPRTVLVFIDPDRKKAHELAHFVIDAYVEAMRGTAQVPDKNILLERALVGDAAEIRDQLSPANPRRFHSEDRLMLWFEFNQLDTERVSARMKYFFEEVVSKL